MGCPLLFKFIRRRVKEKVLAHLRVGWKVDSADDNVWWDRLDPEVAAQPLPHLRSSTSNTTPLIIIQIPSSKGTLKKGTNTVSFYRLALNTTRLVSCVIPAVGSKFVACHAQTRNMPPVTHLKRSQPSINYLFTIQRLQTRQFSSPARPSSSSPLIQAPCFTADKQNESRLTKWISGILLGSSLGLLFWSSSSDSKSPFLISRSVLSFSDSSSHAEESIVDDPPWSNSLLRKFSLPDYSSKFIFGGAYLSYCLNSVVNTLFRIFVCLFFNLASS